MKKLTFIVLALLALTGKASAQESISINDLVVPKGGEATLEINYSLEGSNPYVGFQFLVDLPEGLSLVEDPDDPGYPWYDATVTAISKMSITTTQDNGFAATPKTQTATINGNSGVLMRLKVAADANLSVGSTHEVTLKEISFNVRDESYNVTKISLSNVSFVVTISEASDGRVLLDETSTTAPVASNGPVNVRVKRTINANEWSTICLPFDMTEDQVKDAFGEDVQLAEYIDHEMNDDATQLTINFEDALLSVDGLMANYPYIIKTTNPISEFTVDGVTIDPDEDGALAEWTNGKQGSRKEVYGTFKGTYHAQTVVPSNCLFLSGNKFWYSKGLTNMKAFRAWFDLPDVLASVENAGSRIRINFNNEGSGIRDINRISTGDNNYYDLQGRRVTAPSKGIYVRNGKKVIMK